MKYLKNKQGKFPVWAMIVIGVVVLAGIGLLTFNIGKLSTLQEKPVAPTEYDGEFDDAYLATEGNFYSDFNEDVDCNVSSDVLGGSDYSSCIYNTSVGNVSSGTDYRLDLVLDIDGPVENMEVDSELQNTGTGQAKDDMVITEASLWTYEDEDSSKIQDLAYDNEDGVIEDETGTLQDGEYVFHTILSAQDVSPAFADGDNIMLMDFDLTTDGDADSGRLTLEA